MTKQMKRVYFGDHVYTDVIAMDEAPRKGTGARRIAAAESMRGMAVDHDPMTGHPRFKPPKPSRTEQQRAGLASALVREIFTPKR